jgi:hypothetical protein
MNNHNPALESIQFQKTDLFVGITNCIKDIRTLGNKTSNSAFYGSSQVAELSAVIKKYTGIIFDFEDSNFGPAVYLPRLKQHIFDNEKDLREQQEWISEFDLNYDIRRVMKALEKDVLDGTVDLRNSKVTGVFSSIKCKMFLPRNYISNARYLDEELAAVILHEIGHVFTGFEYLSRSTSTNQALSIMLRAMDKTVNFEDRKIVFAKAKDKLKLDDDAYKLVENQKDPQLVTMVVMNEAIQKSKSELGQSVYDLVSCEYLADQFAARHGAGKYLVTALDKMIGAGDGTGSSAYFHVLFAGMVSLNVLLITAIAIVPAIISFFVIMLGFSISRSHEEVSFIYDNTYTRYSRIKQQMMQRLKSSDITSDEKKVIIQYIEEIDPVIKKHITENNVKLRNKLAFFFSSKHKRDFEYMSLQKDLELIGNNDLYLMSEKLKLI